MKNRIWTEVYSEVQRRWIHFDVRGEARGKKTSYCIAFSIDVAKDVICRYVRKAECTEKRTRCPEEVLLYIIKEIQEVRQAVIPRDERFRLEWEEYREDRELRGYIIASTTQSFVRLLPSGQSMTNINLSPAAKDQKLLADRQDDASMSRESRPPRREKDHSEGLYMSRIS